ncbi:hypothetical protein [Mesorhizobium sp. Pch-S]|uniref:hypothetical protein n=1 Tax=Mesorhizobium sp. Pch-S TaxID=2082387 RepID=UPI001010E7AC|nr:hypothetical protein [Mesorhizobium sp. Pch-S]QAZ45901.1 hypothetical protein C1M53_26300 [Mesorhizobium sp. Pch-S]
MTARDAWMLRDRETGEWQQHVFFEKPDPGRMIAGADFDVIPVRILAPGEIDGPTKERCIAAVEVEQLADNIDVPGDHAYRLAIKDALHALRALPDGGVE